MKLTLIALALLLSTGCTKAQGNAWGNAFATFGAGMAAGAAGAGRGMQAAGNSSPERVTCSSIGNQTYCNGSEGTRVNCTTIGNQTYCR